MSNMAIYLKLAVFFLLLCIAHATFTKDLKKCIQKTIATPSMSERISFCHGLPLDGHEAIDRSVPLDICSSYFFPDVLFWDPLSRIPLIQGFLRCPREACFEKTVSLGPLDGKMERQKGIILIDFMA